MKTAILNAYELVPEAYRQKFRGSTKGDTQTYVEFPHEKERLFDRWCAFMGVEEDFKKLRELMILEEFKNCLPSEVKTYIEEQKTATLRQAAVQSDDYSLTHKTSFEKTNYHSGDKTREQDEANTNLGFPSFSSPNPDRRLTRLPSGPTCFYCKKRGHVMAECRALEKKNQRLLKPDLVVGQQTCSSGHRPPNHKVDDDVANLYAPFLSHGSVSLVGQSAKLSIKMLRDTGATQTLILDSILPFSNESFTGKSVLLQGIELGTVQVPLHNLELSSEIVSGSVVVGLRPSLPVPGVSLILGNDIDGGKVEANPCVSDTPSSDVSDPAEAVTNSFPCCAVTHAMAKANSEKVDEPGDDDMLTSAESMGELQDSISQSARTDATRISMESQAVSESRQSVENVILSLQKLTVDQEKDQEIRKLKRRALNEREAVKVPVCYFIRNGILMRKWRPPDVAALHEWKVIYQIVVPPAY